MLEFENKLYNEGYKFIAGVDEVGRGCLLGDVVACAIAMPKGLVIEDVKDSKKLSEKKREFLYDIILDKALAVGIGRVDSKTIDKINIKQSSRLAMKRAIENMKNKDGKKVLPDYALIDAETIDLNVLQKSIIKGDELSHTISCASIVAKVYRDRLCLEWDNEYPGFNIKKHKGYGTKEHRDNIMFLGATPIHRMTFLKNIIK